jgi:phenylacetate-coenzyme A ligase PaaK-like adenylate-forming protein
MQLLIGIKLQFFMKVNAVARQEIFSVSSIQEFNELAVKIFHFQVDQIPVYRQFVEGLSIDPGPVRHIEQIPFLPISLFKTHKIIGTDLVEQVVFESSGTSGMETSKHYIVDAALYEESFMNCFRIFFGELNEIVIFALLPGYLERGNSSLVYMVERLRWKSNQLFGGFYLHEHEELIIQMKEASRSGKKIMLFGVTHALIDLAEKFTSELPGLMVFETGGMKGRRKELTRMELHELLKKGFGVDKIYSEYGMTELLSQAWSDGNGLFFCPPWMKVLIRDPNDPLGLLPEKGRVGGINVIDLANLYSCSFIATQDLGRINDDGTFEVLGRFDDSDIRGCSLLVS